MNKTLTLHLCYRDMLANFFDAAVPRDTLIASLVYFVTLMHRCFFLTTFRILVCTIHASKEFYHLSCMYRESIVTVQLKTEKLKQKDVLTPPREQIMS